MTDPSTADRTYIGPMTPALVEGIIEKERPDAILPTMGGQTGLNLAKALAESGILAKYGVELIGAKLPSIDKAEDRELFKVAMKDIGLNTPQSGTATSVEEARAVAQAIGGKFPLIIRPAFTLGGTGGGIAYNADEFTEIVSAGVAASLTNQVLVERSLLGWKEYELEVMRDLADNVVIICSIENVDPMGVHTGDSITVAPAQTLTDKEYQRLRDASVAIIREMGVECGGSNVQMAVNPADGEVQVRGGRRGGGGWWVGWEVGTECERGERASPRPPPLSLSLSPYTHNTKRTHTPDHRNEPARLPVVRPGVQGHRLPHRQDRGQAGGGAVAGPGAQ
jgi:carbamoyl-phosphate synthase large subunit